MPHVCWLTPHQLLAESLHFIVFLAWSLHHVIGRLLNCADWIPGVFEIWCQNTTPMTQRPHNDTTATCRWLVISQVGILGFRGSRATAGQGAVCELGSHHLRKWKMERHLFCIKTFAHPFCFAAVFWSPQSSWIFKMSISPWSGQQTYFRIKSKLKTASKLFFKTVAYGA